MSAVLGLVTTATGFTGVVIQEIVKSGKSKIASAQDATGKTTNRAVTSVAKTVEMKGRIDGTMTVKAGDLMEVGSDSYIVEDISVTEISDKYQTFSATLTQEDDAVNVGNTTVVTP